jgi:HAD superfamily hydrolase (TIGR01509 family)
MRAMTIDHIIFDWDGTLARTLDLWLDGYRIAFERRGYDHTPEVLSREFFHNHHLVPDRHPTLDFPPIVAETRNHVLQNAPNVALYDDAQDTLERVISAGVTVTLVTSSGRALLNKGLQAHGLSDEFSSVVTGDCGYGHKPSTKPFEATLDRVGAQAKRTLIIGDSHVDIEAGQALGCQTCWFAPQENALFHDFDRIRAMRPHHEIDRLSRLHGIVLE